MVDLRWILQLYGLLCIVLSLSIVGRVILYVFGGPLVFPFVYSCLRCVVPCLIDSIYFFVFRCVTGDSRLWSTMVDILFKMVGFYMWVD